MSVNAEQKELRDFVDALRNVLGLRALYDSQSQAPENHGLRWMARMEGDGNRQKSAVFGSCAR